MADADDLVDPDRFEIVAPPWALADLSHFDPATGGGALWVRVQDGEHSIALLFTDRDLVDRFMQERGQPTWQACQMPTVPDYVAWLLAVQAQGATHVCFDPGPTHGRSILVEQAIAEARKNLPPEDGS